MPRKTHLDEQPSLNLTPMIDIVFLLIIFFMLGTKFTELERNIGLRVPEVAKAGALTRAPQRRVVEVRRDGSVALDQERVTLAQLRARLADARRQYEDLAVLVRGDKKVEYQGVATVLSVCKQAGIRNLGISVQLVPQQN